MKLKNQFRTCLTLMAATFFFYSCTQEQGTEEEVLFTNITEPELANAIEGQYIVVYKTKAVEDVDSKYPNDYSKAQEAMASKTMEILSKASISNAEIVNVYSKSLKGATLKLTKEQVEQLRGQTEVAYIEQDRIVTFAPPGGDGNVEALSTQETPYGILRVNGVSSYTGSNVAWIVDTGIDLDHPDLIVDASRGFNAFTRGRDSNSTDDGNGHGSHVAGTIAALNNNLGVIGVAPGVTVIPVKVLDSRGSGSYSGVIAGVDHVGANGNVGDVANLSLGGPVSQALDDAVVAASNKGIWFSLAAGNSSEDANLHSPARANGPYIVTISAMDINDNWASFSNFGNPPIDFSAPGVAIKSTWKDGGYNTISGTSMAAPHAAGVLLLGAASTDGTVINDPDNNPDPIIVH